MSAVCYVNMASLLVNLDARNRFKSNKPGKYVKGKTGFLSRKQKRCSNSQHKINCCKINNINVKTRRLCKNAART